MSFLANTTTTHLNDRYPMDKELKTRMIHAICYTCSGRNLSNDPIYRYYKNFQELYEHCINLHSQEVSKHSYVNILITETEWYLIKATKKPPTFVLIRREIVDKHLNTKLRIVNNEKARFSTTNNPHIKKDSGGGGGPSPDEKIIERPNYKKRNSPNEFSIHGWNARSAASLANVYFISAFLIQNNPDFLLINESGKHNDKVCKNCPDYGSFNSNNSLTILYNRSISVTPILKNLWDDIFMTVKITCDKKSMVIVNVYRPPNDDDATERLATKISHLDDRYQSAKIVVFGDLNYKRNEVHKAFKSLSDRKFTILYEEDVDTFTRSQQTINGLQKSYLDYFLVKNVQNYSMKIQDPIGHSDHKSLLIKVLDQSMRIKRMVNLSMPFGKMLKNSDDIASRMSIALTGVFPVNSMAKLINELRAEYRPVLRRTRSYFKLIEGVTNLGNPEVTKKIIRNSNRGGFLEFMNMFETLKTNRSDKEYFARLRFYSDLNSNVGILNNICIMVDNEEIVSSDQDIINQVVYRKYSKLFNSESPPLQLLGNGKVMKYTDQLIRDALKKLSLKKATSWDCIPGKAYQTILNCPDLLTALTDFINDLVRSEKLPDEIAQGRLFCLNKNCNEPGNEKSIRPLVIMSMFVKFIEYPLNLILKSVPLNRAQLGFRERLSTELNILRLRCRLHQLQFEKYDRRTKLAKRYILLVDLSEAFDRVNHQILLKKMVKKNVPEEVLNVLIKLLNSGCIAIDLDQPIKVKSGVGQGKICSPLQFDIYIDDLLDSLEKICHTCLAFADDTGYICTCLEELHKVIDCLEEWSIKNKIAINKKKSGILIINDDAKDCNEIRGFPVVTEYNYLGVLVDSRIKPGRHVAKIREKIKAYLLKNRMLMQKYFTPFSLLRIAEYFVKSRLSYGTSCFLDINLQIEKLNSVLFEHLRSLFSLPSGTSRNRLQLVLGEPDIHVTLATRLLKNCHKYWEHYKEFPEKLRPTLEKYFSHDEISGPCDYKALKARLIHENLMKISKDYPEHKIRFDHKEFLKKYVFTHPNKRDFYLIRFFTNTTKGTNKRLFPKCVCGEDNHARHGLDECKTILSMEEKENYWNTATNLLVQAGVTLTKKETLYDLCSIAYFTVVPVQNGNNQSIRKMIELLKEIVFKTIISYKDQEHNEDESTL